jgi:site-specific recombinase XerD
MGKVIFRLNPHKQDSEGKLPMFLHFNYQGNRFQYYTGEKCLEKEWDLAKQRFKRIFSGYQEANAYLDTLEEKVKKAHREAMLKGSVVSVAELKQVLQPEESKPKPKLFFDYFAEFQQSAKLKGRKYNTLRNYVSLRNHLQEFSQYTGQKLNAEAYDLKVHDKLLEYLVYEVEHAPNSVFSVVKNLKVFFKFLSEERGMKLHPDVAKIKASYISVEKIFLTLEELEQLRKASLRDNLDKVRDVYLFACYTGLRYSDLENLRPMHLVERKGLKLISIIQKKTGTRVELALNTPALAILEKYQGKYERCLPVIVNQKMNYHLKEVGQLAEIEATAEKLVFEKGQPKRVEVKKWELMTVHTARHTFATLSLMKGMTVEVLQKLMGHNKIQNTMVYAKIADDFKHQMMLKVWNE